MAKKKNEDEEIVDLTGIEGFINRNAKYIAMAVGGLVLVAAISLFMRKGAQGKEYEAQVDAISAQQNFQDQVWKAAVDGSDKGPGFVELASKYKGTKLGNMSNYYAGVSYAKLADYDNALTYLSAFKTTEDKNINCLAFLNKGDALMELDRKEEALSAYKKAASIDSEIFQSDCLLRYGMALIEVDMVKNQSEAYKQFNKVVNEFPGTPEAPTASQYVAGLK